MRYFLTFYFLQCLESHVFVYNICAIMWDYVEQWENQSSNISNMIMNEKVENCGMRRVRKGQTEKIVKKI